MFPYQQNPMMINPYSPTSLIQQVNGFEGAKAYQMPFNTKAALFDSNEDIFYLKSIDANGTVTIRKFSFVEILDNETEKSQYVTLDEFNKFKEEILNGKQHIYRGSKPKCNSSNKPYGSNRSNNSAAERHAESEDAHAIDADE